MAFLAHPNVTIIRRIKLTFKRIGLWSIIKLIDILSVAGGLLHRGWVPIRKLGKRFIKRFLLRGILSVYFFILKVQRKARTLAQSSSHTLLSWLNRYLYKITIACIILGTLGHNLWATTLNAEELTTRIPLNTVVGEVDESSVQLIEEGPLSPDAQAARVSYLDTDSVLTDDYIEAPFAPDTDDDTLYGPEDDQPIIAPVITDPSTSPGTQRTKIETYVVQSGDTIGTIAQQFNISINTILWANNLSWNSTIRIGQQLTILPSSGVSHTVKSGDTVSSIAKRYQVDTDSVIAANKLANAADIQIGEVLIVPNGINPTAVTVRPRASQSIGSVIKDILIPGSAGSEQELGGKFLWPLKSKRMTQYFHLRHKGLDIGDKTGNPIYAAESGKVEISGWNRGGYGYYVIINHGNGVKTLYGHASKLLVKAGETVERGQSIALIGSTGRSTGPHLHFEVRINGRVVNPLNYIR